MTTNSETIEQQSTDSDNLGQLRHHEHQQPPPPVPNTRRRSSFNFSLPTPNLVGSIAEGAHYAGGLPSPHSAQSELHSSSEHHVKHKRPEQLGSDDPAVEQVYRSVIADLHEIYCGRITLDILRRRFKRDVVFEDPLCLASGYDQFAAQWFGLAKVVTKSERTTFRIITATVSPNRLIFEQTQVYTFKLFSFTKTIPSVIIVDLDEDFRITRLEDQWHGNPLPKRWGASFLRRLNAKVTPWIFSVPKDNT